MSKEIERKFLISGENIPILHERGYQDIMQGYAINFSHNYIYRLRQILYSTHDKLVLGDRYYQTIKGVGQKIRDEFEIELFKNQFDYMWNLCEKQSLHKFRYILPKYEMENNCDGVKEIALDVYKNKLSGLFTIEIEFLTEEDCDKYIPEKWFGDEVTYDEKYSNFNLALSNSSIETL